jgi:hypothetical protein
MTKKYIFTVQIPNRSRRAVVSIVAANRLAAENALKRLSSIRCDSGEVLGRASDLRFVREEKIMGKLEYWEEE